MRKILLAAINFYQATLSPDHGPRKRLYPQGYCRFYPTCSEYAKIAIHQHGAAIGTRLALKRLVRCHPWSAGGLDPVPRP